MSPAMKRLHSLAIGFVAIFNLWSNWKPTGQLVSNCFHKLGECIFPPEHVLLAQGTAVLAHFLRPGCPQVYLDNDWPVGLQLEHKAAM